MSPRKHPLFILAGNAPCGNRGSQAIILSTIAIVEREFGPSNFISSVQSPHGASDARVIAMPNVTHVAASAPGSPLSPAWLRAQFRRRLLGRTDFPFAPYLREAEAFIARAGDNFTLDYGRPQQEFAAVRMALQAGKPTILYGATIGPFGAAPEFEKSAFEELKKVTLICVRESLTREYLAQGGVVENVREVPDPAFVLKAVEPPLEPEIRAMLCEGCLAFNISSLAGQYTGHAKTWPEQALQCLRSVDRTVDLPILLVPHVMYHHNDDNDDLVFMAELLARMHKPRNPIRLLCSDLNSSQLKWVISQATVFVGARTHATIAALSSCVPTVSIGYSRKAHGLNKDIFGHLDWVVPVQALGPDRLVEVVTQLLSQAKLVRTELEQKMPDYISRAWSGGRCIREAMEVAGRGPR